MATVLLNTVTPVYAEGITLQWEIVDPDVGVYQITVQRSGSSAGPWEDLSTQLDGFMYVDSEADTNGLSRDIYYRLSVVSPGGSTLLSNVRNVQDVLPLGQAGRHFLRARKMRMDLLRTFQKFSGRQYYILKRKHWGERCPTCYDSVTRMTVRQDCTDCYGTTFNGGYYDPILVWGRFDPAVLNSPLQIEGSADQRMRRFVMLDVPWLMHDDVIVSSTMDRRYRVITHSQTEMREVTVHQDLSVAELQRDDDVYAFPVGA